MKFIIESFKEFIESLSEKQTDPDLVDKVEKEESDAQENCPRCGEGIEGCKCVDEDPSSTVNLYRIPKGKEIKN